eukprot:5607159-Prymnesium_polylepis.1
MGIIIFGALLFRSRIYFSPTLAAAACPWPCALPGAWGRGAGPASGSWLPPPGGPVGRRAREPFRSAP